MGMDDEYGDDDYCNSGESERRHDRRRNDVRRADDRKAAMRLVFQIVGASTGIVFIVGFLVSILGYRFTGNGEDIRRNGERIGVLFARDSAKAASIDSLRYSVRAVLTMTCINFTITHATQVPIECDAVLRRIP